MIVVAVDSAQLDVSLPGMQLLIDIAVVGSAVRRVIGSWPTTRLSILCDSCCCRRYPFTVVPLPCNPFPLS